MTAGMFVIRDDGQLVELQQQGYVSEDVLQSLLAKHPSLLVGNQIDSAAPRRWLLVSREAGVPSQEGGGPRWSIDHVFLDQDAIPTLVEVKRSSDTRIRREVVGQMLDYAANAIVYWPPEEMRMKFVSTCESQGRNPDQVLVEFLGSEVEHDQFWSKVKTNLQAGRLRLVFVADEIPAELQRIVEFLNSQMDPAEVLAVEIRQYVGENVRTLVPRVLGQTANAQRKKGHVQTSGTKWSEETFFSHLQERRGADAVRTARAIYDWAYQQGVRIWWGEGTKDGSFYPMLDIGNTTHWLISVWTYGRPEVQFQYMNKPPFDDPGKRQELLERLNQIPGVAIPPDALTRRPSIQLTTLAPDASLQQSIATLNWIVQEIRMMEKP